MARQQTTRYAVLGMLSLGPRSGYDIKQEIGASIHYFWSESYGQVYPVLRDLVNEGYATVHVEATEGRPSRKVYTITEEGLDELRGWLVRPVEPQPNRNELLLKLFFGRQVPESALIDVVADVRDRWARDLAEWATVEERMRAHQSPHDRDLRDRLFTLAYGRVVGEATLRWADDVIAELTSASGEDPETPSGMASTSSVSDPR